MLIIKETRNGEAEVLPEYQAETVRFVISSGRSTAEVARNLDIAETTPRHWVAKVRENGEAREPELDTSVRAELARPHNQNQQLTMARDLQDRDRQDHSHVATTMR